MPTHPPNLCGPSLPRKCPILPLPACTLVSLLPSLEQLLGGGGQQSPLLRESPEPGPAPFPRRGTWSMGAGTQTVLRHGEAGAEPGAARGPSGCLLGHGRCCRHGRPPAAGPQPPVQAAHPPPGEPEDCSQGLREGRQGWGWEWASVGRGLGSLA